ncbi:MAG: nickel pincer cofactor biosynthesis protein LarB [Desulfonatronovibrio sp. MSAO_Bac4]|nr:MAG: nickel pincer cofactor biosynthesis protein LarB [Desulfonatronovibrio sp. MSAO_Bac4]
MLKKELLEILDKISSGELSSEKALRKIIHQPFMEAANGLNLDLHRGLRTGVSEVIFGLGKSLEQLYSAVEALSTGNAPVMVTKVGKDSGLALEERFPKGKYWEIPKIFILNKDIDLGLPCPVHGRVQIVSAGGADLPVALEALATALFFNVDAGLISDVGVAGLHRLFPHLEALSKAEIIIAVAGMEGALPSVVAGLCDKPVVAVPTSVGYGTSFSGVTPLLAMLTSCAPGISVVNIDNGFGAACFAVKVVGSGKRM